MDPNLLATVVVLGAVGVIGNLAWHVRKLLRAMALRAEAEALAIVGGVITPKGDSVMAADRVAAKVGR